LSVPGSPEIFVVGDAAHVLRPDGRPVPGVAPAAKQQGRHVAATLKARLAGDTSPRPFRYRHDGDLATIGKRAAVIDFGWIKLTGWAAWWLWGIAHIYFLIGFRNRLIVMVDWAWAYFTYERSARVVAEPDSNAAERRS
jgi:NADH dehydrogenase